ncbi:MAG TPA: hypothetical protein VKA57_00995 [Solirubrobacteraceae bacterium]|nr:hypothetical protein [Solirubrobacteraceae bacterium]
MSVAVVAALCLAIAPAALAGKGGGKPTSGSSSSTFNLVLVNSTDGVPHYGQDVTFEVSTTATSRPMVSLACNQGGTMVYAGTVGFYDGYPWSKNFTLASSWWTGGAADCSARLYYTGSNGREITLKTMGIAVYA